MAVRSTLSSAGAPALWLPAPLPLRRPACPSTSLPAEETRRGGPPALLAPARLADRRSLRSPPIRSAGAPGRDCVAAASSVDDALAAARARRRCECRSTATAVRERPSAPAGASATPQPLTQYPWPVDPQWLASAVGGNPSLPPPARPSGAARRGVPPQLATDRPASGAARATRQPPTPSAGANGQASLQPALNRSAVRTQSEAERLAQTVRCVSARRRAFRLRHPAQSRDSYLWRIQSLHLKKPFSHGHCSPAPLMDIIIVLPARSGCLLGSGSLAQSVMSSLMLGRDGSFDCHGRWAAEGGADGVRRVVGRDIMELGYGLATGFPVPLGYAPRDALSWPRRPAERRVLAPPRITRPEVSPVPVGVCNLEFKFCMSTGWSSRGMKLRAGAECESCLESVTGSALGLGRSARALAVVRPRQHTGIAKLCRLRCCQHNVSEGCSRTPRRQGLTSSLCQGDAHGSARRAPHDRRSRRRSAPRARRWRMRRRGGRRPRPAGRRPRWRPSSGRRRSAPRRGPCGTPRAPPACCSSMRATSAGEHTAGIPPLAGFRVLPCLLPCLWFRLAGLSTW